MQQFLVFFFFCFPNLAQQKLTLISMESAMESAHSLLLPDGTIKPSAGRSVRQAEMWHCTAILSFPLNKVAERKQLNCLWMAGGWGPNAFNFWPAMFPICCFSGSDSSQAVPSLLQAAGPGQSYSLLVLICSLVCLLLAKSLGIKCALMHSVRASDASQPVLSYQFHLKGDLSSTSLLPLLKHTTHHLAIFTSTVWSP